jgi:hypothetical protein
MVASSTTPEPAAAELRPGEGGEPGSAVASFAEKRNMLAVTTATYRPLADWEVLVDTRILRLFLGFSTPYPDFFRDPARRLA